jgi:hypothetical protein
MTALFPAWLNEVWEVIYHETSDDPQCLLHSHILEQEHVKALTQCGLQVVCLLSKQDCSFYVIDQDQDKQEQPQRWEHSRSEEFPNLVQAVPVRKVRGEPLAKQAVFLFHDVQTYAGFFLEKLLLLGRSDARVWRWGSPEKSMFCIWLESPPLYLLMVARDEQSPTMECLVPHASERFWLPWGYSHPLAEHLARTMQDSEHKALISLNNRWHFVPATWESQSIYDAVIPTLESRTEELVSQSVERSFQVRLRLAPADRQHSELWLLTAEQFLALEPLVSESDSKQLAQVRVSRLSANHTIYYVLQEKVAHPSLSWGSKLNDFLDIVGYSKMIGTDNLYLPSNCRLIPQLRREEYKSLLHLERYPIVILTQQSGYTATFHIRDWQPTPLSRWVEYIAMDERFELDTLLETSVFEFPSAEIIDKPERKTTMGLAPEAKEIPEFTVGKAKKKRKPTPKEENALQKEGLDPDVAQWQEEAKIYEIQLAQGGIAQPELWRELAVRKEKLQEYDEARFCYSKAIFHAGLPSDPSVIDRLFQITNALSGKIPNDEELLKVVVQDTHSLEEMSWIAAMILQKLAQNQPPSDELMHVVTPLLLKPQMAIQQALVWAALCAWYRYLDDKIALTRAKEQILGRLNIEGLHSLYDVPRFVRMILAFSDDASHVARFTDTSQLQNLELLWQEQLRQGLPELYAHSCYARLIFAVGFSRLGAKDKARELVQEVEEELPIHDLPNQILFRLYFARIAFNSSDSDPSEWKSIVETTFAKRQKTGRNTAQLEREAFETDRIVRWLQQRSLWLRVPEEPKVDRFPTPIVELLEKVQDQTSLASNTLEHAWLYETEFDRSRIAVLKELLKITLESGKEESVLQLIAKTLSMIPQMTIVPCRMAAYNHCLRVATQLEQHDIIIKIYELLIPLAGDKNLSYAPELPEGFLLLLQGLLHTENKELLEVFFDMLASIRGCSESATLALHAAVARGMYTMGEHARAHSLLQRILYDTITSRLDPIGRFDAACALLNYLHYFPQPERSEYLMGIMKNVDIFRDTFSTRKYYFTHKVLLLEHLVDSIVDNTTHKRSIFHHYLDTEEHSFRRKLLQDWRSVCGT